MKKSCEIETKIDEFPDDLILVSKKIIEYIENDRTDEAIKDMIKTEVYEIITED